MTNLTSAIGQLFSVDDDAVDERREIIMYYTALACVFSVGLSALSGGMVIAESIAPLVTEDAMAVTLKVYIGSLVATAIAVWTVAQYILSRKSAADLRFSLIEENIRQIMAILDDLKKRLPK